MLKMKTGILVTLVFLVLGCTSLSFNPHPLEQVGFQRRAQTKTVGNVEVSVVALTEAETRAAMGVDLARKGIQPVWLKICNSEDILFGIPPMVIDHDYFSPMEVAWREHGWLTPGTNARIDEYFRKSRLPFAVRPAETVSGFVFTNLDKGVKYVSVELLGVKGRQVRHVNFLANVPDLNVDYTQLKRELQRNEQYHAGEVPNLDETTFRTWIERLPCCVLGGDRKTPGDPLNVVFVGEAPTLFPALARQGWHVTETITARSTWQTISSSVFGEPFRYGPVSPLYFFGRQQDIAVQKARASVNERNHMRLWRAAVNENGSAVWVGQISRDIGVRLTTKTITTHKIDPDVDADRWYLMQDTFYSQSLLRYGFAKGVGAATPDKPRANYTGDPYWTDGLRLVMWLSPKPVTFLEVKSVEWESVQP